MKPGTDPARKQKQCSESHCTGTSSERASPSSLLREVGGPRGGEIESGVFDCETQKSLCLEDQSRAEDSKVVSDFGTCYNCHYIGTKDLPVRSEICTKCREHNRRSKNKDRWGLAVVIDKAIQDCRLIEFVPKFNLEKLCTELGDAIMSGEYSFDSLQKLWEEHSGGLVLNFEGVNTYGFDDKKDLRKQLLAAFELVHSLEEKPKTKRRTSDLDPKPLGESVSKENSQNVIVPRLPRKTSKIPIPKPRKSKVNVGILPVTPGACSSGLNIDSNGNSKEQTTGVKVKKQAPLAPNLTKTMNNLGFKLVDGCWKLEKEELVTKKKHYAPLAPHTMGNVLIMGKNDDLGQYQAGKDVTKKVPGATFDEVLKINQIKQESDQLPSFEETRTTMLEVDIARPVIDNLANVEKKAQKKEVPGKFVIKYKPSLFKKVFFGRKEQQFYSNLPANHGSHNIRKQARKGNFRFDTIPDRCIIPSLHSYLVRRRDVSYPDYKTKLAHLHKLAKAWENDEMPLSMHKANPTMLNNYYLTISKVANCTDVELIVAPHQEDVNDTFWSRIRAALFGHTLVSD